MDNQWLYDLSNASFDELQCPHSVSSSRTRHSFLGEGGVIRSSGLAAAPALLAHRSRSDTEYQYLYITVIDLEKNKEVFYLAPGAPGRMLMRCRRRCCDTNSLGHSSRQQVNKEYQINFFGLTSRMVSAIFMPACISEAWERS